MACRHVTRNIFIIKNLLLEIPRCFSSSLFYAETSPSIFCIKIFSRFGIDDDAWHVIATTIVALFENVTMS